MASAAADHSFLPRAVAAVRAVYRVDGGHIAWAEEGGGDTTLLTCEHALVLLVHAPGIEAVPGAPTLEVIVDLRRDLLQAGTETYPYLTENAEDVELPDGERTPAFFARAASTWFTAQLSGPMQRR